MAANAAITELDVVTSKVAERVRVAATETARTAGGLGLSDAATQVLIARLHSLADWLEEVGKRGLDPTNMPDVPDEIPLEG